MRALREMLQQHSLEEADRMASIKPELTYKLRSVLKELTD
jgi:hypothetical protein